MKIFSQIENEISDYLSKDVEISEGFRFSQYKLIKRLMLYANGIYPKGKINNQGNYKYWVDISTPRVDNEVKNIDFDTKDIILYSDVRNDLGAMIIMNLALAEWLRNNGKGIELNDAVEEGAGWGNVVWKKIKDGYEKSNLKDLYIINQTARTLDDSPCIERHNLTQSDLRAKMGVWKNIEEVIRSCGDKRFSATPQGSGESKETPNYEIFERNGEISEASLFEAQDKTGGDDNKYLLAKVIVAGLRKGESGSAKVLFADEIKEMPYREYHRGAYKGRWFRVGIYEILFDIQTRANEISNQIARGLEWASKTIFSSEDRLLVNNILTDMNNGDVIKAKNIRQIEIRMQGLDQLIADWNRLMAAADKLCNSYEVMMGENLPSGTSFKLGAMVNQNAGKLFVFIRQKLGLSLQEVFQNWVLPDLVNNLKKKDVLRVTGDESGLKQFYEICVNGWYIKNLIALPPHTEEEGKALRQAKVQELMNQKGDKFIELEDKWLEGVKPRVMVIIVGENINLQGKIESLATAMQAEPDPIRRSAIIEYGLMLRGIDISDLPKTETQPEQIQQRQNKQSIKQPQEGTVAK